jgi:hypothetical protein
MGRAALPVQRRNFADPTSMLVQFRTNPGSQRSPTKTITPTVAIIIFGGLRELAAQMVEDEIDRRTVVGPAADVVIAIPGVQ